MTRIFGHVIAVLFFFLVIDSAAVAGKSTASTLVRPFVGEWAGSLAHCGLGAFDDAIKLTAKGFQGWESSCNFKSVVRKGSHWKIDADCSGEGEKYGLSWYISMPNKNTLLFHPADNTGKVATYYRCPGS